MATVLAQRTASLCMFGPRSAGLNSIRSSRRMSVRVAAQALPDVPVKIRMDQETTLKEVFKGQKGILFGVPGAFTPGCQEVHMVGYMEKAEEFKAAGCETIAVIATNDAFTMQEWSKVTGGGDKGIVFLSDFTGGVAKELGLDQVVPPLNDHTRFKRCSAIINNNEIVKLNVEPDGTGKSVSLAEPTLDQFKAM